MSKNYINVSVSTSKPTRVSVSTPANQQNVDVTRDTSAYNAEIAKQWATSENLVLNEDYSAKHYAKEAKKSEQNAESFESATRETYDSFVTNANSYIEELTKTKEEVTEEINEAVASGKDEINSTKTTILNDIEFVADGEKKEIEDLIDNGKEELKESIGDVKVLITLEIGDIGIAPLGIDETKGKRRYLNGQLIIQEQYVQFTNKVKSAVAIYPSLACTEEEWQTTATMTVGGQVGKFVVDDEAGTIRLPKIIMPIQGLTDLSKLGEIVEAGLPNITGSVYFDRSFGDDPSNGKGALYYTRNAGNAYGLNFASSIGKFNGTIALDASESNPTYGNSNTVQQEQIQYPYFIQVATGAETEDNIINEIELNNPFSLLDYKYSEYELNNLSWLRSQGQYNSKAIYPAVYDLLLKIYNGTETKAGVSVKLTTETFTDYDFVLNTAEETFRLPIKVKLPNSKGVAGNGMATGYTNGTDNFGMFLGVNDNIIGSKNAYGQNVGDNCSTSSAATYDVRSAGITTDSTKSGIEVKNDSSIYLYFYVGETVQNANLINAGRIEEKIASLIPDSSSLISGYSMPSNKYIDLTLGASGTEYTAPANGWYYIAKNTSGYQYFQFYNLTKKYFDRRTGNSITVFFITPVSKGDIVQVGYNASGATDAFRFYYAEGEQ